MPTHDKITYKVYKDAKAFLLYILNNNIKFYSIPYMLICVYECLAIIVVWEKLSTSTNDAILTDGELTDNLFNDSSFRVFRNTISHSPYKYNKIEYRIKSLLYSNVIRSIFSKSSIDLKYVSKVMNMLRDYLKFIQGEISNRNNNRINNNIRTKASKLVRPELLDEFLKTLENQDISDEALEFYAKIFNQSR